ncbi:ATP-binding protein [Pendulispora rubella]|uniref:histidine kinase n=1 Tax=Pendulispora rubella TaxID=2741070 RepID=A0ABZ2LC33_9BACT
MKTSTLVAWMLAAIALVTVLAYWDEQKESAAMLNDFAQEPLALADALSASPEHLTAAIHAVERPHAVRVFVAKPGTEGLTASDGSVLRSKALEGSHGAVRLSRPEAADLGLPARTALAGVRAFEAADGRRWTVAVVATAQAFRDREMRGQWRLVLCVVVASGLVLAFGGLAMRTQRKELELSHQLAVTTLRNERDERLVRADKLATMGALATGIAHEVSTPLGVIVGRAEQLLPKQTDDRARRAVESILQQTERIDAVIRGFLSLARGAEPSLAHREAAAVARTAVELVEHRFEKAAVRLTTDIPEDLPKIACDARLFEQVLVNLLLNACDACDRNATAGTVHLAVRRGEQGDVEFTVTDDGVGISADAAERATEPFFTTKPEGNGTGLGLAITNEIVKHHRGSLTLRPRADGRGTRASVSLPIAGDDHA